MRRRRSILDLPPSSDQGTETDSSEALSIPDYARPGQPMTFRRWIRMVFGPGSLPGGNRPQGQMLLGSWALFALIGLSIPDNVLEYEWARNFCDFMATIVPQIDRVTDLGFRPEVNRFHYSILWAFAPIYGVWCVVSTEKTFTHAKVRVTPYDGIRYGLGCAALAGVLMFAVYGWFGDMQESRQAHATFGSVVIRALWAPFYVGATLVLPLLSIVYFRRMIAEQLNRYKGMRNDG